LKIPLYKVHTNTHTPGQGLGLSSRRHPLKVTLASENTALGDVIRSNLAEEVYQRFGGACHLGVKEYVRSGRLSRNVVIFHRVLQSPMPKRTTVQFILTNRSSVTTKLLPDFVSCGRVSIAEETKRHS